MSKTQTAKKPMSRSLHRSYPPGSSYTLVYDSFAKEWKATLRAGDWLFEIVSKDLQPQVAITRLVVLYKARVQLEKAKTRMAKVLKNQGRDSRQPSESGAA
jgi:hypothetical protein